MQFLIQNNPYNLVYAFCRYKLPLPFGQPFPNLSRFILFSQQGSMEFLSGLISTVCTLLVSHDISDELTCLYSITVNQIIGNIAHSVMPNYALISYRGSTSVLQLAIEKNDCELEVIELL